MINQFQDQIPQPLVGIGHSMGGMQLAHLSLMHPSLFEGLVLIDPVIQRENPGRKYARGIHVPTRPTALTSTSNRKVPDQFILPGMNPRVFDKWIQYGLRDLPTPLYPITEETGPSAVTLTTTKAQELFYYMRPSYIDGRSGLPRGYPEEEMHPDDVDKTYPFYRPEPAWMFRRLPELKPAVLYLFGDKSDLSSPTARREKVESTGTGVGGSGGAARGLVQEVFLPCGHMVPMERVRESAEASASFIAARLSAWERLPHLDQVSVDLQWEREVGALPKRSKI